MVSSSFLRREANYVLCEWGCGAWMRMGAGQRTHEKDLCTKRVMPCRNEGCPVCTFDSCVAPQGTLHACY